ncbi:MAG: hypothetical protein AB8B54_09580 [Sphingorhabdus sp.]
MAKQFPSVTKVDTPLLDDHLYEARLKRKPRVDTARSEAKSS